MACTELPTSPHSAAGPAIIDRYHLVGIDTELPIEPSLTPDQDVGALLFGRVCGPFVRVWPRRAKNRHSVP